MRYAEWLVRNRWLVAAASLFAVNAKMGLMTAMAIGFALLIDFLFLPPLPMLLERRGKPRRTATAG